MVDFRSAHLASTDLMVRVRPGPHGPTPRRNCLFSSLLLLFRISAIVVSLTKEVKFG